MTGPGVVLTEDEYAQVEQALAASCRAFGDIAELTLAVCADCPVQADCLAYAMSFGGGNFQVSGVWGGTTDRRRRKMRRWARQDAA